jgi:hypothetical protein
MGEILKESLVNISQRTRWKFRDFSLNSTVIRCIP